MTRRALPTAGVVGAGRTPLCRHATPSPLVRQGNMLGWLQTASLPDFRSHRQDSRWKQDYPFAKVSLQMLQENQAVHNRSHHSGLDSLTLTSLILEGLPLLRVLVLPCFQRGWKAETQIHNVQQISQVLAGGLSPRVRRGLCITPQPAVTGPALHQIHLPTGRVLQQTRVLEAAGPPAQAAAAPGTWWERGTPRCCRHPLRMRSKKKQTCFFFYMKKKPKQ